MLFFFCFSFLCISQPIVAVCVIVFILLTFLVCCSLWRVLTIVEPLTRCVYWRENNKKKVVKAKTNNVNNTLALALSFCVLNFFCFILEEKSTAPIVVINWPFNKKNDLHNFHFYFPFYFRFCFKFSIPFCYMINVLWWVSIFDNLNRNCFASWWNIKRFILILIEHRELTYRRYSFLLLISWLI